MAATEAVNHRQRHTTALSNGGQTDLHDIVPSRCGEGDMKKKG
jgi:hypothetical protein